MIKHVRILLSDAGVATAIFTSAAGGVFPIAILKDNSVEKRDSNVNLSILKIGKAKGVRFDILEYHP